MYINPIDKQIMEFPHPKMISKDQGQYYHNPHTPSPNAHGSIGKRIYQTGELRD